MKRPINGVEEETTTTTEIKQEPTTEGEEISENCNKKLKFVNNNNFLNEEGGMLSSTTTTTPPPAAVTTTTPPPPLETTMDSSSDEQENNNTCSQEKKLNGGGGGGDDTPSSKVVHIRNIPSDVSETEIVHLGIPFGRVSNVLVLKGKNQAFLELADEPSAIAMVSYFTNCVAQLRGRSVYVQFSTHKELKTDQSHSNANSAAQAALAAAQALVLSSSTSPQSQTPPQNLLQAQQLLQQNLNESITSTQQQQNGTQGGPNTVLRVIIEQMVYPVTLDVLYQIFSRVGKVLRIVTFTKNNFFQALIQYPDVVMAQAAKLTLDGQNIYNNCCTLRIEYSKLSSLNVRYNNDKSRDYTNPTLPTGETSSDPFSSNHTHHHHQNGSLSSMLNLQQQQQLAAALLSSNNSSSGLNSNSSNSGSVQAAAALAAAAALGIQGGGQSNGFLLHTHHHHGGSQGGGGHHHHGHQLVLHHHQQQQQQQQQQQHHRNLLMSGVLPGMLHHQQQGNGGGSPGCVLLVSNLNEELITPDGLFTLFGVYGDVQRVKILFNKKDSALVQMREPTQAQLALTYLDRLRLHQKLLRVTLSKHTLVQMPKEGQPDAGLTKDYTASPLHRFKKPDSKNYQNIYAPSATLHLSNIPASVSEEEIMEAFKGEGFANGDGGGGDGVRGVVKGFKFFPKDRKMALLQLNSIEEAAEALIRMHNYQLRENSHLRVSFSKSTI